MNKAPYGWWLVPSLAGGVVIWYYVIRYALSFI